MKNDTYKNIKISMEIEGVLDNSWECRKIFKKDYDKITDFIDKVLKVPN